jgi:cellulose synthase/poly-beta-1,6-N-acetylglucosamine synthase-like glycosyltransferase
MRNPFPAELSLVPVSRWPLSLPEATLETVLGQSLPNTGGGGVRNSDPPAVSIIVVSYNNLVFNRLCLESVLANTPSTEFELIVVDNGSRDGTGAYLQKLAGLNACIKILFNEENLGFAAACNQGLSVARGDALVLLNHCSSKLAQWVA